MTPLDALRDRCGQSRLLERDLLWFLAEMGISESVGSLEDLANSFPEVVQQVLDEWADISQRVKGMAQPE
jgi:hypothetical protein